MISNIHAITFTLTSDQLQVQVICINARTTETEKKITRNGKGSHQPPIVTVDVHGFQVSVRSLECFKPFHCQSE